MAAINTRANLHRLLDELPDELLEETGLYIRALQTGNRLLLKLLSAPFEDPLPDEIEALAEIEDDDDPAEDVSLEDFKHELGL